MNERGEQEIRKNVATDRQRVSESERIERKRVRRQMSRKSNLEFVTIKLNFTISVIFFSFCSLKNTLSCKFRSFPDKVRCSTYGRFMMKISHHTFRSEEDLFCH